MRYNVLILGLVSFFTDISSEMIYPLIPIYLTTVLGASPAMLGIIEGIAESMASFLKVASGRMSDRTTKRKPLAIFGYGLSTVGKLLFIVATSWTGILWARVSDRFGKGIRTAPRDALLVDSCVAEDRGKAFGLHRAMDAAGAVIGIGLAYWLFTRYNGAYDTVFWLAVIPAALGVALLFLVRETVACVNPVKTTVAFSWQGLDRRLKFFLVISFLFNLGNSSNQFLLLRANDFGFTPAQVILLYLGMSITHLLSVYPAGCLSDQLGRRVLLVSGYLIYGLVYIGFAMAENSTTIVTLFVIYGIYIGLTEGVEKALLADIAPSEQKASVYGLHAMITGLTLLPASVIAGYLWDWYGAPAPFYLGGALGLVAAIAIAFGLKKTNCNVLPSTKG